MCGIFCSICSSDEAQEIDANLVVLLKNRGPDDHKIILRKNILFGGFVLWQQGSVVSSQPICLNNWTLLLNGDIFNTNIGDGSSDTSWLAQKLSLCSDDDDILALFQSLKGPYSVIMYDENCDCLYFARDPLGRNSMIIEKDSSHLRILSNSFISDLSSDTLSMELPPFGLYKINLKNIGCVCLYPWVSTSVSLEALQQIFPVTNVSKCVYPEWLQPSKSKGLFDFYELSSSVPQGEDIYDYLLDKRSVNDSICQFLKVLRNSVKERVSFTPKLCNKCVGHLQPNCKHSKIGILFSGGIDCTILAVIADQFVDKDESIDLINVAFEAAKAKETNWNVPDRCSSRESYEELKRLCPKRNWKLVEVNVTRKELNERLESHIKHLIYPLNTVLDESLGCAFWFASRGQGYYNEEPYKSTTRVILIGSGADELFGGYTRHRNAYTRCLGSHDDKILSLSKELEMDWERLPSRNLGRDDRVIADNGKTARAPFIQEDLVQFVRSLQPYQRCCFTIEQGVGDKLFLRLCGYQIGLRSAVKLKKRAIQFGSRIANKNQNAKDVSTSIQ